ncbi:MAG: hypothetical protein AAGI37_21155 [Planctomycetota bacterium]
MIQVLEDSLSITPIKGIDVYKVTVLENVKDLLAVAEKHRCVPEGETDNTPTFHGKVLVIGDLAPTSPGSIRLESDDSIQASPALSAWDLLRELAKAHGITIELGDEPKGR